MIERVTEENFVFFAARNYDAKASCYCREEFEEDMARFKYLRRLLTRYKEDGQLRERLIMNHLIVLFNMFGAATVKMVLLRNEEHWPTLFPFLEFLGWLPNTIHGVGEHEVIDTQRIKQDEVAVAALSKL